MAGKRANNNSWIVGFISDLGSAYSIPDLWLYRPPTIFVWGYRNLPLYRFTGQPVFYLLVFRYNKRALIFLIYLTL
jgi:hypothetical protein